MITLRPIRPLPLFLVAMSIVTLIALGLRPRPSVGPNPEITVQLTGEALFQTRCAACHRLDGVADISVPLNDLFGRRVASVAGFDYSDELKSRRGTWTPDRFRRFLLERRAYFPKTTMPEIRIGPDQVDVLIDYLRQFEKG